MRTLIRNACLVTMDDELGDIPRGDLLIQDGRIVAVGERLSGDGAQTIDADGCIAIPGFVDAHRHLWEGAMRSVTADWSILDFVGNIRLLAAQFFRPEDMYATSLHGGLEALDSGITTVADYCHNARTVEHVRQAIAGVRASGIRAIWGYSFTGLAPDGARDHGSDGEIAFVERLAAEEFGEGGLVSLGICPEEPMHWQEGANAVRDQFALARRIGARMFMHANSVPSFSGGFEREVEKLDGIGGLGPDLALVHMGHTEADEWALLGAAGGHAVFTPDTELQMGLGSPPITEATDAGVNIGLGVDITANNSADMFTQMRLALQVERARLMEREPGRVFRSRAPIACREALHWATLGSARACGLGEQVGSLSVGKEADVVLLRADGLSLAGWDRRNPAATVVLQAGPRNVDTVLVSGKVVKSEGQLLVDPADAVRALEATSAHVHRKVAEAGGFDASEPVLFHRLGFGSAG